MNRIYKVIWNRVKNCYVVVSEIANNRGKINGRSTTCVGTLLCILALVGGTLLPLNTANAVNPAGTGAGVSWGNGTNSGTDQNNVAIGGYAQALGPVSLALGAHSNSSASYSTAIGGGTQSTAENATAIGGVAKAQGKNATAIGAKAEANGEYATTIGAGAKADNTYAIAIGSLSHATEVSSLAMGNNSKATNTYAYAIGGSAEAKGRWSIAMGTNAVAEDDASVSIGTWSKATTGQSVAVGYLANAKQLGATALGRQTNASAVDATAIGSGSNSTAENGTAIGKSALVSAKNSVAIGTGAKATNENAVALGTGSETAAAVATASESVNGVVHNFAGINPGSTVSVGKTGMERTVTNVAAGRISATSTDAINGSQLYAVTTEVNKGTVYAGDVKGTGATDNKFTQRLGAQTNIVGGVADTSKLSDNNIGVVSNGTDTLNVKLAKELKDLTSVTAGDTVMNTDGVTITGGPKIVKTGIDAGNKQIVNVASGGDVTTNGANIGDINRIITAKDKYVTGGSVTYQANGEGAANLTGTNGLTANVSGLKNNYVTSGSISNDGKVLTLERNDTGKVNVDLSNIFTEVAKGDYRLVENPEAGSQGKYKVDSNGNMVLTVANDKGDKKQVTLTDIASKAQQDNNTSSITTINTTLDKGLNFAGDTGAVSNRKLGDTVTVKGGATGALSDGNIGVESDGNGTLNVKLAKTLSGLDSVTAGGTTINNSGLTVGGKNYVSPTGLNANDQKITNVSDGTVGAGSKDAVNGGQLHDAKNELNTNISNAKTDLINKGLRFDADNNDVKTNKLGSKVTVNGDDNITTEITQTGDDTKIGVKLNKNLNVQTLTATDTVKAGGVTMGKHADSNNYVTGLDNKDWDVNTSNPVSGRAATEDQLRKISDVIKSQGAAATDYRLVKNAAAADEAYTVDSNGDVDLTVEDKNHAGSKETVKIKDVASKSSLDKLTDRAVKYDLDPAGTVDKTKVSYEGPTYANKTGGTHVTNVAYATGNNGSEAVNVDYLKDRIKDSEDALTNKGLKFDANNGGVKTNKLGSKVTVKGDNSNIITSISQDANGDSTIDVKLGKDLKTETITATGKDGKDGKIGINGKDGVTTNISVTRDGKPGVDGANGTTTTRIVYQKPDGTNEEVANLNDGMMYGGDTGNVIKKKLNNQVNVKGGISDESKLATEDNIGVVSDGSDTLKLRLAKELKGLTSATFTNGGNNTVINGDGMTINRAGGNAVSLTKDGLNNGGNKITNVADGTDPNDAVNKSQLDKATAAASTTVSGSDNITVTPSTNANGSKNYEVSLKDKVTLGTDATKQIAIDGTTGTIKAGDKVTIDGNKGTIKAGNVTIDGENGTIKAGDKVTIDGKDGKIAAGKVSVDGKDGYVTGLENKDWDPNNITSGRAATEDQLQKSHKALDNKITNLGDEITKKGMNFAGNTGEFHRDLGQKVTIKGEGTESDDKYSGENIKTVADQDGNVTIKMAKNLKTDSLTTDKVKVGKNGKDGVSITGPNGVDGTDGKVGITGKDGKDAVSMSGKDGVGHIGLNGKDGRSADISVEKGDPDLDGNEITRIKYQDENGKTHQVATKDDGMKYGGDSGAVINKKLNEQVNVIGGITDASKLTTEDNLGVVSDGTGNLKVRMAKDLKGLETVTTKDAAGNTTVMNGGGVTITPASGNAVSLTKDGLNNGGNTITNVAAGVNGTDAVNVNQLKGATDKMANAINAVAGETQRVGAHAAAMSALKPIQYDPLEPTQVMAGIGNYRGETAAALGIAHYTAEDTMFHVGMSVGSHHNMVNAGVTHKFGNSDAKKAIPDRYKGGPISSVYVLQDEVTALKAENARMQESLNELSSVKADNEQMKAQIALLMQQAGLTK
ncbi:ESPR-type extended signal peptide-containing protein [uncultured Veillonella sp.]|uniref:ESPR-type extended signal peptide-containing protein n=1 Tax=uncultured Veillonella sp. TaxID=159268 RepID=UPI0028055882|nr:ESPR-type extended signal peptide-containing protein [uncultured Veillonella sp.]